MNNSAIRLHIPAIPYTITRDEYSHDAFTGKVKRFSPMMRSLGFEVYHYGVETSESGATKDIQLFTKEEWNNYRIRTFQFLDDKCSWDEAVKKNNDETIVVNTLSNWASPLAKEFNKRFKQKLIENYRSTETDIVCVPLGRTYQDALDELNFVKVELGIGYTGSFYDFRIFESYSWMARTLGVENVQPSNYWFVVPHGFDIEEFQFSNKPNSLKVGYMGRVTDLKGCVIIKEVAKRFPNVEFVMCGQGDPAPFLDNKIPNLKYKKPIHGKQRSDFLGECIAFIHPAKYLEPFGCGPVEAQLCGTPVICSDWGGMAETVEQFKTGVRCHTLADYCYGIQMAIDAKFDRKYIRNRATHLYDMYKLAFNYEYIFKSILDIWNPDKNGWYSPDRHIATMNNEDSQLETPIQNSPIHNIEVLNTSTKTSHIPKIIWQTWATKDLPFNMLQCVNKLKASHTDFEYNLFNDEECYSFIKENYPIEVLYAYESLIPTAYKADLWRLCVLYKYGGAYLDIKLQFCNNYTLHDFIDKEYFVNDGTGSIYNAFLVCKKGNPVLLKTIQHIVENVSNNYYGETPYSPTATRLLGKIYELYHKPIFELTHYGPKSYETVKKAEQNVLTHYAGYREEQAAIAKTPYYVESWLNKEIYNQSQNKLQEITKRKSWSASFNSLFKNSTPRIYIILVYYGTFPNYFQLYLDSLGINKDILTVFLITDIDTSSYVVPDNLILINSSLQDVKQRAAKFILNTYNKVVNTENIILNNYKLVDFKIVFPILFDDILKKYNVSSNDYIGWGDCDLIYGKISNFLDLKENYGIIGGWHGHFTAIINNDNFKNNFKTIPNYFDIVTDNSKVYIADEIAYREPLKKYLADNNIKMFYINRYFCDIVPPCFYHLSRPNYKDCDNNFYDLYNPTKTIKHLYFDKINSKLIVTYTNGETRETIYGHLQKRKMELPFSSYENGFLINENSFSL